MDWLEIIAALCLIAVGIIIGAAVAYPLGKRNARGINIHRGGETDSYSYGCARSHRYFRILSPNIPNKRRTR